MASDPSVWNRSVPFVSDGDAVNAKNTNAPTRVLADRTANLKAVLDAIEAGEQLTLRNAPLAENVPEGAVVYLESTTLEQTLAQAQWADLETEDGRLEPASTAVYTGIVLSKAADRVGDILMNGVGELTANGQTNLFNGESPENGLYYLSSLNPGTVERTSPAMSVRVLSYEGSGLVRVYPPQHEPITHTHRDYLLDTDEWLLASSFDAGLAPEGATYGYNLNGDQAISQELGQALLPSVGKATFLYLYSLAEAASSSASSSAPEEFCALGGLHVNETSIVLDENGIWWFETAAPGCDIEMSVTSADTKGIALLHTIQSLTPEAIEITVDNGRVKVSHVELTTAEDTNSSHIVVKDIVENQMQKGPVVTSLSVGPGLQRTSPQGDGVGDISLESTLFADFRVAAQVLNLNNTVTSVDSPWVVTLFPTNRNGSINCQALIPFLGTNSYSIVIYAQFLTPGSGQAAPEITDITFAPTPDAAGVTPVVAAVTTFPSFPGTVAAGDLYLLETNDTFLIDDYSQGVVAYTISANNPSTELRLVNTGIRLILN